MTLSSFVLFKEASLAFTSVISVIGLGKKSVEVPTEIEILSKAEVCLCQDLPVCIYVTNSRDRLILYLLNSVTQTLTLIGKTQNSHVFN